MLARVTGVVRGGGYQQCYRREGWQTVTVLRDGVVIEGEFPQKRCCMPGEAKVVLRGSPHNFCRWQAGCAEDSDQEESAAGEHARASLASGRICRSGRLVRCGAEWTVTGRVRTDESDRTTG